MMNQILGRTRLFTAVALLTIITIACSSGGDDEIAGLESSVESSTTTTTEATTTTTEATTTTLSEQAQAEADVAQIAEAFWSAPIDTSQGLVGLEYTTGVLELRLQDVLDRYEGNGRVLFNDQINPFEVISVDVDLEQGEAEVKACKSSYSVILDADTGDELFVSDHEFLATIVFYLEETDDGWKIYEQIGTAESEDPERCEISS